MLKSLEELRVQRRLIQKHLDWLDAQIEQAESFKRTCGSTANEETVKNPQNPEFEDREPLAETSNRSDFSVSDKKTVNSEGDEATIFSETLDAQQIKFGCIAFFAIIILLFLFILFVLPYLIT